jgi:hypothetical protein
MTQPDALLAFLIGRAQRNRMKPNEAPPPVLSATGLGQARLSGLK